MNKDTPETKASATSKVDKKPLDNKHKDDVVITPSKPTTTKKGTKTRTWVIIAVVLLIIIVAGAYFAWSLRPANALASGISNLVKTRDETFSIELQTRSVDGLATALTGQGGYSDGNYHLSVSAAEGLGITGTVELKHLAEGDTFVKLSEIQDTLGSFMMQGTPVDATPEQTLEAEIGNAMIQPLVDSIENQWIAISADQLENSFDATTSENYKCIQDTLSLLDQRSTRNELANIYSSNSFIVVDEELGTEDGAIGFRVSIDDDILEEWSDRMGDVEIVEKLNACNVAGDEDEQEVAISEGLNIIPSEGAVNETSTTLEIWVDQIGHNVRSIEATTVNNNNTVQSILTIDFTQDFDADFSAPSDSVSIDSLLVGSMAPELPAGMETYESPEALPLQEPIN